ncbi:mucin-19 isoform X1 [Bactrocera dorsalis]|uniref:Mucin-19 isoform X1 n=4 Tax=Bactrocera dorsalis TaxID=27457 RepID=A0A6I9VD51_BACDO|nr:mucin-19 isoform X1 [Bactrocera dorsalis]
MSRRQSLDRPGILSPPGPFLTPSPSPSISASPRLQPSPSLSPFQQDVLLVAGNTITSATHDQERKTATPGRRQSLHQFTNGSPNAGTVVFQPSPSQSPAAATSVIGVTAGVGGAAIAANTPAAGNEFNTTLVGSNNIQLNKKGNKRITQQQQQQLLQQQQNQLNQQHHQIFSSAVTPTTCHTASSISNTVAGGYGQSHAAAINTSSSFATANVAGCPKGQAKKAAATVLPTSTSLSQQQQQQFQHYHSSSPLIADSPIPSPSNTITAATIKPSTPQPMQMLQQQFTITGNAPHQTNQPQHTQQVFQIIQGPQGQIVAAPAGQQHTLQQRLIGSNATLQTHVTPTSYSSLSSTTTNTTTKSVKPPQQILPKPQQQPYNDASQQQQQQQQQHKSKLGGGNAATATVHSHTNNMAQMPQISQSPQPQQAQITSGGPGQQQQILLPTGATASLTAQQPLLLNQMPVLVQQNTPQGVQLILRPPTPQLTATPSLVIQNARPQAQLQQQQPQQLLRILGTNGATMQLAAATPTFIVSSQANLIQQTANHIQTIKTNPQNPAITQLTGLHAALSASNQQRSHQPFTTTATINTSHLLGPSVAAQLQNLQLAAAAANGGSITQIQMPNGPSPTTATILSQLPAHFQQSLNNAAAGGSSLINLNQLSGANIQQLAAAAAAAGATFQTPPPPPTSSSANVDMFNAQQNALPSLTHSTSQASQPIRQPTPTLLQSAGITGGTVTINQQQQLSNGQPANSMMNASPANSGATNTSLQAQQQQSSAPQTEPKKKAKPRKKKQTAASAAAAAAVQSPAVTTTAPSPTLQVKNVPNTTPSSTANLITNKFSTPVSMSYSTGVMPQLQFSQTSPQNVKLTFTNSNSNTGPSQTNQPPQQQQEQARPKLDLGNVMKLCGIMEDDDDDEDYMDTMSTHGDRATTPASNATQPPQTPTHATSTSTTQAPAPPNANDIMISIPSQNGTDSLPFTVTIPASAALGGATASSNAGHDTTEPHNIFIKIDQNDTASTPYTISIPRLPTAEEIQQQAQQHLAQQAAAAAAAAAAQQQQQHSNNKIGAATMNFTMSSASNLPQLQAMQPTQAQPQPLFNITAGGASLQLPTSISNPTVATTTSATTTTTTTTATVKPRRKPAVRRNGKKQDNSNVVTNASTVTPSTAAAASITTTTTTTNSVSVMPSLTTAITPAMSSSTGAQVQQQQQQQQQGISTTLSHPASTVTTTTPTTASTLAATVAGAPQVPSQIGNIQISQVDTTKMLPNHNSGCGAVENKIQIMPILDSATGAGGGLHIKATTLAPSSQYQTQHNQQHQQQQLQQQHHQQPQNIIFQPPNSQANVQTHDSPAATIKLTADGRHVQLVAIPQTSGSTATAAASSNQTPTVQQQPTNSMASSSGSANNSIMSTPGLTSATILPPQLTGMPSNVSISVGSPATAAALMPQLTGNLTLTVSEQGERLILRHNASQPQDQQSQLLLQALLKGALPNVTIINEPTKLDNSNNSGSNNNIGATNSTQNNRVGLSATTPQLLPPSSLNSTMHHQHAKTLISTNTGAISKLTIPAQVATAVGAKTPTIQLQFNAGPTSLTSSGATANGTTGPTLQLPQQSPQLQMQQQQQQQQQKTFQQTQQQPNMLNPARTPDMAQLIQQQQPHQQQQPMLPQPPSNALLGAASLAAQSQQRYVSLPKINAATQQIFSLNSETNQITPISPTQTAASIGPTERLLIAPAGINAQQLAQCLQLGQIHFNDVNPLPPSTQPQPTLLGMNTTLSANQQAVQQQQQRLQPPQQQIVHPQPIQPLSNVASGVNTNNSTASTNTVTKQIANVAPIIDQSKAKLEPPRNAASTGAVAKKKPVRKPKATTTAADVASGTAGIKNASVVKPMPKLDPLSQKPNNNPVQIVQPNVASGKQVGATAASNNMTTTTGTNSIQPFQTQQQTTKLVGVTAPMQQLVTSGTAAQQQQQQQLQPSSTASMLLQSPSMRSFVSSANIVGCSTTPTNSSNNSLVSTAITSSNGMTLTSSSTVVAPSFSINTEPPSLSALNSSNNTNVLQQQTQMQVQQQQPTQVQLPQQSPQQPQHTVSRVQTIQLTAQQQQMFKQVQMQIQFLTIKLQHKSLLTSLPLPSDFDPAAIAAYTKPMSDAEINVALQRLYTEQQRILAAGKEMPTPEAYLQMPPIGTGSGITLMTQPPQMQQQQQQQVGVGKSNTSVIPANVVQPNNHSSTMTVTATSMSGAASGQQAQTQAGVTHRIHIYPMQHHQTVQQNKQNQQQQQSKLQSSTVSRGKDNNNSNGKGKNITPTQQQATQNSNSNNISTLMPLSQPKQQPMLVPTSKAPALVFQPQQQQQQQQFMLQKPVLVTSSSASSSAMMNGPPPLVFSSPLIAASAAATATSAANASTATHFATGANGFIQQQQQHVLQQQLHALSQAPTSNLSTLAPSMAPISATTTALTSASHTSTMMTSAAATTTSASHTNNVTCVTTIANATSTTTAAPAHTTTITTTAATGTSIMTTASTTTIDAQANMQLQQSTNSSYALTATTNAPATAMPAPMLGAHLFRREESLSPQPKLARLSLFLRQLELDQQAALNPDYVNPFQNKEEAVKRLIRYHCLYESVEDLPYEDEERFEQTALQYQEKYHKISNKYQKIIIQESTLEHRTSETCQIQQLMIDDLRAEMEHLRNAEREQALYEQQQQQKEINEPKCESLIATTTQELKHEMKAVKDEPEMEGDKADYNSLGAEQKSFEIKTEPNDIGNNKANATGREVAMGGATAETTTAPTIVDKFDLLKHSTSHNTTPNNAANKQQRVLQTEQQQHQQQSDEKHQYDLLPKKEEKRNWHNAGSGEGGSYANNSHFDSFDSEAAKDKLGASNFYANCNKQLNGTIKREIVPSSVACGYVKKEFENFDIESEITPSFIMKKVEHKEVVAAPAPTAANNAKTQNKHGREKNERSNAHEQQQQQKSIASAPSNNSFAAQYLQHNTKQQQLQQQQQLKQQQTQQQQQQQQQDDGWLCLQKELSLITAQNKMMMQLQDQQQMTLQQQQQHSTLNNGQTGQLIDLFPNGCINKNNQLSPSSSDSSQHQLQQQQQQQQNCDQQGVQPASDEPLQNHHQNQGQQQQQQEQQNAHNHMQSSLNEFFDSGDDMADVHKSVETRLEAMFGESPVHLSKNDGSDPHDIEAGLEDIFGDGKSNDDNVDNKSKQQQQQQQQRLWDTELSAANSFMRVTNTQENVLFESEQQQMHLNQQHMQQSMQLNITGNTTRWMQNIDGAFGDFIDNASADCEISRKRRWNAELMAVDADDTLDGAKKICPMSASSSSSGSPISAQQHQSRQHHDSIMEADLLSLHDGIRVEPAAAQMLQMSTQQQGVFCQTQHQAFSNLLDGVGGHHQQHFNNAQQQHSMQQQQSHHPLHSHLQAHMHNNHIGGGDFDDDISRHVQNAIDSILNLQNSESADSLNFSLDHSMGSLLGDSILDDRQQQQASVNCQDGVKRRHHLVDELGDCLISGGGSGPAAGDNASNILLDSSQHHHVQQQQLALLNHNHMQGLQQNNHQHHQQQQQQQQHQPPQQHHHQQQETSQQALLANDFSCVAAGLVDEAVKSIMTS